jgi:hypothetical protein
MYIGEIVGRVWTGLIWLRIGTGGRSEHGNELSGCIKGGEFF